MNVSHEEQQKIWEREHKNPHVLPPMDTHEPSGVVVKFMKWLQTHANTSHMRGIEMGCGKGRNVIFLAKEGFRMTGFDFATSAIKEARRRVADANMERKATFVVHDATTTWPFEDRIFDFAVDNFASSDIESFEGRKFARDEMMRVVKPEGYVYISALSNEDKMAKELLLEDLEEQNAYRYKSSGKFEKVFSAREIEEFYKDLTLAAKEKVAKTANFFGKDYPCLHWWLVFQKR